MGVQELRWGWSLTRGCLEVSSRGNAPDVVLCKVAAQLLVHQFVAVAEACWRLASQRQALSRHAHSHPLESGLAGCRGSLWQIGALQSSHGIRLLTEHTHSQASVAAKSDISTQWMQLSS